MCLLLTKRDAFANSSTRSSGQPLIAKTPSAGRPIRAAMVASKLMSVDPLVWKRILPCKNSANTQPRDQTSAAKLYRRISSCLRLVSVLVFANSVAPSISGDASTAMALPIAGTFCSTELGHVVFNQAGVTNSNTSGARYQQVQKLRVSVGRTLCKREQPKSEILATSRQP